MMKKLFSTRGGTLIGYDSTTIVRENIGGGSIKSKILFAGIVILKKTVGGATRGC